MLLAPIPRADGKKPKPTPAELESEGDGFMALFNSQRGDG